MAGIACTHVAMGWISGVLYSQVSRTHSCFRESEGRLIYVGQGPTDEDINSDDASTPTPVPIAGPLTRARACKINHQVSCLLSSCPSCFD